MKKITFNWKKVFTFITQSKSNIFLLISMLFMGLFFVMVYFSYMLVGIQTKGLLVDFLGRSNLIVALFASVIPLGIFLVAKGYHYFSKSEPVALFNYFNMYRLFSLTIITFIIVLSITISSDFVPQPYTQKLNFNINQAGFADGDDFIFVTMSMKNTILPIKGGQLDFNYDIEIPKELVEQNITIDDVYVEIYSVSEVNHTLLLPRKYFMENYSDSRHPYNLSSGHSIILPIENYIEYHFMVTFDNENYEVGSYGRLKLVEESFSLDKEYSQRNIAISILVFALSFTIGSVLTGVEAFKRMGDKN